MGERISPLAFIGPGVELGADVTIGPGAVILGPCVVEDGAWIGAGAQIGAPPEMTDQAQNAAWAGDLAHAGVRIGSRAVIREGAVVHQGSYRETTVGAGAWILNRAYVAHDVLVGEAATVSAGVSIGGHCVISSASAAGIPERSRVSSNRSPEAYADTIASMAMASVPLRSSPIVFTPWILSGEP